MREEERGGRDEKKEPTNQITTVETIDDIEKNYGYN